MIDIVMNLEKDFYLFIVDDGFLDGIVDLVWEKQEVYFGCVFFKEWQGKLGLGMVYIVGFKWGLEYGYEFIFEMDVDFFYNFNDLIWLYEVCV